MALPRPFILFVLLLCLSATPSLGDDYPLAGDGVGHLFSYVVRKKDTLYANEAHKALGAQSARNVGVALVVRPDRIPTFLEGFRAANTGILLHPVANLAEAQAWLKQNAQPNDIILFENDLPDVYEKRLVL